MATRPSPTGSARPARTATVRAADERKVTLTIKIHRFNPEVRGEET